MPRVFEPTSMTLLVTNRCTALCRHCCMNSGPDRPETLSYAQMEHILTAIFRELPGLFLIVFAGGEPMLLGEDLYRAIALCKKHNKITRLVTNAYWASSPEAARARVAELRAAGLDELNLSTDDYHLPYISTQRLKYAWEAAQEESVDFLSVVLANCAGPNSWLSAERVEKEFGGGPMARRFDDQGQSQPIVQLGRRTTVLSNANLQRIGRGLDHLADSDLPAGSADELLHHGGCPWAVRCAAVSPTGHLLSCCGFELDNNPILDYGDMLTRPLAELLDRADGDLTTNLIAILGPPLIKHLLEQVAPDEVSFPRDYRTYCEVCSDLVHSKQNRAALYRHQGRLVDTVLAVREKLTEQYGRGDRVALPLDLVVYPQLDKGEG